MILAKYIKEDKAEQFIETANAIALSGAQVAPEWIAASIVSITMYDSKFNTKEGFVLYECKKISSDDPLTFGE